MLYHNNNQPQQEKKIQYQTPQGSTTTRKEDLMRATKTSTIY